MDVIPALKTNAEGLKSVLEGLVKEYKKKQQEMDKWKVCYHVFFSPLESFRYSPDISFLMIALESHPLFSPTFGSQFTYRILSSSFGTETDGLGAD